MQDQHLTIAVRSGDAADDRQPSVLRHRRRRLDAHRLQQQGHRPSLLHNRGILQDTLRILSRFTPTAIPAKLMHRLGTKPQMGHHRHRGPSHSLNRGSQTPINLHLDTVATRLSHEPTRITHRILRRDLITQEGHVADQERIRRSAAHAGRHRQHLVHGHRNGRPVPQANFGISIAYQNHVDARLNQQNSR